MKKLLQFIILFFAFGILITCEKENNPPKIQSTTASPQKVKIGKNTQLTCVATDPDGDQLTYSWSSSSGTFLIGTIGSSVTWKAPDESGTYTISVIANDGQNVVNGTVDVEILQSTTVEGYVYYSGTLIPVSGVTVSIGDVLFTTGESGHFLLQNIAIGNTELKANKLNFDNFFKRIIVNETANTVNIEMTSDKYTHNVYGNINDNEGNFIPGVTVSLLNPDKSVSSIITTSDAKGYYQLPSVPLGSRIIIFEKQTYQFFQGNIFISNSDYPYSVKLTKLLGEYTDPRDGIKYKWIEIGNQVWMAENLAYLPTVSPISAYSSIESRYYVYGYEGTNVAAAKQQANYTTYGVLYNWRAARNACPNGWRLPTDDEWKQLEMSLGMSQSDADDSGLRGTNEGTKLKATSGWEYNGNGSDDFRFSALPGGGYDSNGFSRIGRFGYWWSSSEEGTDSAWGRTLNYYDTKVYSATGFQGSGYSVRCVRY